VHRGVVDVSHAVLVEILLERYLDLDHVGEGVLVEEFGKVSQFHTVIIFASVGAGGHA
jgi:hypothetical protein